MYALYLNSKHKVLGFYMVSRGSIDKTICSPADILRPALLLGCGSIILIHNHPSGIPDPSGEDLSVTKAMIEACRLLGLTLLDHIIIGQGCYRSIISMV
jgi:DNA repair protein RadC